MWTGYQIIPSHDTYMFMESSLQDFEEVEYWGLDFEVHDYCGTRFTVLDYDRY